jgi:hypothetical protein
MKKLKVLLISIIFLSAGSSFQVIYAQDKTKADQEKEAKLQQSIDQQKKALELQRKAKEKSELELMDSRIELDSSMKDMQIQLDELGKPGSQMRVYRNRGNRAYSVDAAPFVWAGPEGGYEFFGHGFGDDENRTTWDFSKSVKENTFTRDYTFDVEKTVNNVVMSVMGDCKAGDIHIKIIMPNGKSYSDIIIDEFGNLNWRKSFSISETENQDKTGEWKFQIASNKATGFFKISLQTY